jgi:hypothetical protein
LANLFGIINRSLIMWWWVQNSLNGMDKRLDPSRQNQKSLRRISHRQWTRPRKAFNIYISETIDLWRKGEGPKMARDQFLVSIPSLLEPSTGSPSCSLDRLDCLPKRKQKSK